MKKKLLMVLSLAMVAVIAITGTMAYLTSTDDDVNVMTVGNVKIDQIEKERVTQTNSGTDELKDFSQDKPLYPAVGEIKWAEGTAGRVYQQWSTGGSSALFDANLKNVVDKMVFVENTGISDAYVRTVFAFEAGTMTAEQINNKLIHWNRNTDHWSWTDFSDDMTIEVDGVKYFVRTATYTGNAGTNKDVHTNGVLPAGETTRPSLLQLFLDKEATNELCASFGEEYDILVVSQAVQAAGFADATTALNEAFGNISVSNHPFNGIKTDSWDGTADTTWYNDTATEFTLTTSEQFAGLAKLVDSGKTFEGKTITLNKDVDLYAEDENREAICFEPIGSYRNETAFKGTFDGKGHTISNLNQNTWALDNGYYYGDLGLGLFGLVEDATIKDLVVDGASISGESAICGTVAATASGDCTFENIQIKNSNVADYQYYAGGIVGWASGNHQYINCEVDESNIIAAQWGDFDNSTGGVIGGCGGSATISLKDCNVACRIDAYNDVTSSYQWYAYRRCGMLIGNTGKTEAIDGTTYAAAPQLTAENCTVTYGDWANYTYCEFAGMSWPYVRVQAGVSNSAYSNPRYGHPTDANGNTVTDDNHVHNDGEDHQILCKFDQLYGGGQGVSGAATHDGVKVIYK